MKELNQSIKHKSSFVGEMIAFSICNKPFKPLGLPSGRVNSREGLPEMIPTDIEKHYVINQTKPTHKHMVHISCACLTK
jgi:hypothetical protein